jgi:hypothetical protein
MQELGGIGETRRSKVPNVRRIRESEIRDMPRIAMETWVMLFARTTSTPRMLSVLLLVLFLTCDVHGSFVIHENGVLVPSSSEHHSYDDSWSVNFNNVDAIDFDILVYEVCREEPCPLQLDKLSELIDCAEFMNQFNDSAWYNQYVSEQVSMAFVVASTTRATSFKLAPTPFFWTETDGLG